jgi:predicted Zn-dependent protease
MKTLRVAAGLAAVVLLAWGCQEVSRGIESVADAVAEGTEEGSVLHSGASALRSFARTFKELDPAEEHYIGRAVSASLISRHPVDHATPEVERYLNQVGLVLAASSPEVRHPFADYHFVVLKSETVNAFASPGGTIMVTNGLLRLCRNEEDLAGVLAHEIGHVTLKHPLKAIQASNLSSGLKSAAEATASHQARNQTPEQRRQIATSFGSVIGDIGHELEKGYGQDDEFEADQLAVRVAAAAGYDPAGLKAVIARLGQAQGHDGFFTTHPPATERLQRLSGAAGSAPSADAVKVRTERFRRIMKQ